MNSDTNSPNSDHVSSMGTHYVYTPTTSSDWPSSVFENTRSRTRDRSTSSSTKSESPTTKRTTTLARSTSSSSDGSSSGNSSSSGKINNQSEIIINDDNGDYIRLLIPFYLPLWYLFCNLMNYSYNIHNEDEESFNGLLYLTWIGFGISALSVLVSKFEFNIAVIVCLSFGIYLETLYYPISEDHIQQTIHYVAVWSTLWVFVLGLSSIIYLINCLHRSVNQSDDDFIQLPQF